MGEKSKKQSHKKLSWGILFGIPLLLFISAAALFSIAAGGYIKEAYYLYDVIGKDKNMPAAVSVKSEKIRFPMWGEEYGTLNISTAGIDCKVFFGDGEEELLKGAGHSDGSMFPGEGGNIVLAGFRQTVFRNLGKVQKNDEIIFNTNYGKYVYRVSETKIVSGSDITITDPTDQEQLTLYTGYPFDTIGDVSKRYVVIAELAEGKSIKDLPDGGEN
ncbi:MAG: class D sortase [Clostridiaceae bacterium]